MLSTCVVASQKTSHPSHSALRCTWLPAVLSAIDKSDMEPPSTPEAGEAAKNQEDDAAQVIALDSRALPTGDGCDNKRDRANIEPGHGRRNSAAAVVAECGSGKPPKEAPSQSPEKVPESHGDATVNTMELEEGSTLRAGMEGHVSSLSRMEPCVISFLSELGISQQPQEVTAKMHTVETPEDLSALKEQLHARELDGMSKQEQTLLGDALELVEANGTELSDFRRSMLSAGQNSSDGSDVSEMSSTGSPNATGQVFENDAKVKVPLSADTFPMLGKVLSSDEKGNCLVEHHDIGKNEKIETLVKSSQLESANQCQRRPKAPSKCFDPSEKPVGEKKRPAGSSTSPKRRNTRNPRH